MFTWYCGTTVRRVPRNHIGKITDPGRDKVFITVIKCPGRDAGTNPVNLYRFGNPLIDYRQAVWMLHRTSVPLDETKQIRYYLVLMSL